MTDHRAERVRALNDKFRESIATANPLGKVYMTQGIAAHGEPFGVNVIAALKALGYDDFTKDIDPHGEHDMMRVTVAGVVVWGKIDYYSTDDPDLGSEDPSDPTQTERVLTILLPDEY